MKKIELPLSRAVMPERESSAIPWTLMSAINASIRSGITALESGDTVIND